MMALNAVLPRHRWSEEADGGVAHVLAVDDSFVDRKVIERLLKISSCRVTAVDSGRRALQFLGIDEEEQKNGAVEEGLKIDLIITDYCMPGMTGYDLLKKIKESSAFREVPVVIMSSENVLARINRCLEEGAEEFIVKPVKLSDVKRLKDQLMAKETPPANTEARGKTVINNKRKLSDGPDLSTSPTSSESQSQSSPSIASPRSSPSESPDFTPSPPPPLRSSPSPPPLVSPDGMPTPLTELDEIIGECPL